MTTLQKFRSSKITRYTVYDGAHIMFGHLNRVATRSNQRFTVLHNLLISAFRNVDQIL